MDILDQLTLALGFATLAGLNLYLTVAVTGLAVRFGWVDLFEKYTSLDILGNPWIIGVATVLFLIEFFADKIPWVDTAWDSVHTIVRPVGGIMLALAALGQLDPAIAVIAALLSGGATLSTHMAKAGSRALINLSPEPVSNVVASVGEDGLVLGGLGLMALSPTLALIFFVILVIVSIVIASYTFKFLRRAYTKIRSFKKAPQPPQPLGNA